MIIPTHRIPTTPGEILLENWLKPMGWTQGKLAKKMGVDVQMINGIIKGRRSVTAKTALLLGKVLKTGPEFWLNAQRCLDLYKAMAELKRERAERRKSAQPQKHVELRKSA